MPGTELLSSPDAQLPFGAADILLERPNLPAVAGPVGELCVKARDTYLHDDTTPSQEFTSMEPYRPGEIGSLN